MREMCSLSPDCSLKENLQIVCGASMMSWDIFPVVEASLPLLITLYKLESDMADMRPK